MDYLKAYSWNTKIAGMFIALLLTISGCSSNAVPTTSPVKVEESKQNQTPEQQVTTPVKDTAPTAAATTPIVAPAPIPVVEPEPSPATVTPPVVAPTSAPVVPAVVVSKPTPAAPPVVTPTPTPKQTPQAVTVYITKTGKKYHRDGCRYLSKSKISISLSDAESEGYGPCSVCNPPQ